PAAEGFRSARRRGEGGRCRDGRFPAGIAGPRAGAHRLSSGAVGETRREARLRSTRTRRGGPNRPTAPRRQLSPPVGGTPHRLPHRPGPRRSPDRLRRIPAGPRSQTDAAGHPTPRRVAARGRDPRRPRERRGYAAGVRRQFRSGVPARMIETAAVLGAGAVARALLQALPVAGVRVLASWHRRSGLEPPPLRDVDVVLLAVSDQAVSEVCGRLEVGPGQLVAHLAGALGLSPLAAARRK